MPATAPLTAVRAERSPQTAPRQLDDPGCAVCPHSVAHHDAIGLRFCRATRTSAIDRGCVCRPL